MDAITRFQASLPPATRDIKEAPDNRQAALKHAAQDFEAMMVEQMLKSMHQASDALGKSSLTHSREQDFWQEWQDSRLAQEIAKDQGLGLAEHIIKQVSAIESAD